MTIETCGAADTIDRVLANRGRVEKPTGLGVCYRLAVSKRFLRAATAVLALRAAPAAAGDDWFGRDKALHFGATFVIASAGYAGGAALSREPVVRLGVGATLAMGAGIAKEMYDRTSGGDPSLRDLTWDAIGTATGLLTSWLIDHYLLSDRR
jgi:uncharacterized protein YfiM (DUF2279 family)